MNRRQFILGGGSAAAMALAGCIGRAQETNGQSNPDHRSTISVSDGGEVTAEPDLAVVSVAVEATGESADEVRDELAESAETVRTALLEFGIDEDDVTTGRFHIGEQRRSRQTDETGPATFEGVHELTVEVHDVDHAGSVIDVAVDAGADRIRRVSFTLSDERREELREEAFELAIKNARSDADLIAAQLNATVVGVKSVDATGGHIRPYSLDVAEVAEDDAGTELHPNEVTVSATLHIVYYIDE